MDATTPTLKHPEPRLQQHEDDGLMPDLPVPSLVDSDESPDLPPIVSPGLDENPFDLTASPRLPECWGHRGASANFRKSPQFTEARRPSPSCMHPVTEPAPKQPGLGHASQALTRA